MSGARNAWRHDGLLRRVASEGDSRGRFARTSGRLRGYLPFTLNTGSTSGRDRARFNVVCWALDRTDRIERRDSSGVRRFERVAATDFTVLIEGAIGPQPHPSFIDFSCEAPLGDGYREMARAGED